MTTAALIIGFLAILSLTQLTRQALRRPALLVNRPAPMASRPLR